MQSAGPDSHCARQQSKRHHVVAAGRGWRCHHCPRFARSRRGLERLRKEECPARGGGRRPLEGGASPSHRDVRPRVTSPPPPPPSPLVEPPSSS
eukprot:4008363-Pyramimonas_sp.AAC.1